MTGRWRLLLTIPLLALLLAGCARVAVSRSTVQAALTEVAQSTRQWSGVAVSRGGRIFVSFPRWADSWGPAVAELLPNGKQRPFPDAIWNPPPGAAGQLPMEYFISAQGLFVDAADFLWVLDTANPRLSGVVPDGAKLVRIDLRTNRVVLEIPLPEDVVLPRSYLSDVRVDLRSGIAYIADAGSGALIVTDVAERTSRRLLAGHPSVTSEGVTINVGGEAWRMPDGSLPDVHLHSLALSPAGDYLYYQALTGRTLYRVPTALLRDQTLPRDELEKGVQMVGQTWVTDGMDFAPDGHLYLTDIEHGAVRRLNRHGEPELVVQDPRLSWPDTLAAAFDGALYLTTSQAQRISGTGPYRLFRLDVLPGGG